MTLRNRDVFLVGVLIGQFLSVLAFIYGFLNAAAENAGEADD